MQETVSTSNTDAETLLALGEALEQSYILDQASEGPTQLRIAGAIVYVGMDRMVKVQRHGHAVFGLGADTDPVARLAAAFTDAQTGVGV